MGYIVNAKLLLEVDSEAEAADGTNELLRDLQKTQVPTSCLVDYAFDVGEKVEIASNYEEGEAFKHEMNDIPEDLKNIYFEATADKDFLTRNEATAAIGEISAMAKELLDEIAKDQNTSLHAYKTVLENIYHETTTDVAGLPREEAVCILQTVGEIILKSFEKANGKNNIPENKIETPRPYSEWHEDHGDVLWWLYPVHEAPWVGSPLDLGRTVSFDVTIQIGRDVYETQAKKVGDTGGWPWAEADEETLSRLFWTPLPKANEIDETIRNIIKTNI